MVVAIILSDHVAVLVLKYFMITRNSPAGQGRAEGKGTIANCSHKLIKSTWSKIGFFDFSFVGRHLESV